MLQKYRIFLVFPILIIIIFTFVNFKDFIILNNYSISVVKSIYQGSIIGDYPIIDNDLVSHYKWLILMDKRQTIQEISEKSAYKGFIQRSKFFANMVRVLNPKDLELALEAEISYPKTKDYLYWVLDSAESDIELSKKTINELIILDPQDTVAWQRLGWLLWNNGNQEEGLQAYLKACEINDRESNGCYYVGISYRSLGDIENAIFYFRKSYWPPSWEIADQLEAEVSSQNP